jgi:hypothetical protein
VLYSRLLTCKKYAQELSDAKTQPINPIAIDLGLADPALANNGIENGENPAQYYYGHLLSLAESLFEGTIDANQFEEYCRVMFRNKAYIMFTLDKVIASVVKQVNICSQCLGSYKPLSETSGRKSYLPWSKQTDRARRATLDNKLHIECKLRALLGLKTIFTRSNMYVVFEMLISASRVTKCHHSTSPETRSHSG